MYQVKIFHHKDHYALEIDMNSWFEENSNVTITEIRWHNEDSSTVMIIYKADRK